MTTDAPPTTLAAMKRRSCLVCHEPATNEAQLCAACVEQGARVENDTLYITLEINLPWNAEKPRPPEGERGIVPR